MWLEKDPSLASALTSELECLHYELCQITAHKHSCVMGPLADCGLGLKPKLMMLLPGS